MDLWALAQQVGAAGAVLLLGALAAGRAGVWAWGYQLTEANKRTEECNAQWKARYDTAVAEWKDRLRTEAEDYERRIEREQELSARWQDLALGAHGILRDAAHALDKAVK